MTENCNRDMKPLIEQKPATGQFCYYAIDHPNVSIITPNASISTITVNSHHYPSCESSTTASKHPPTRVTHQKRARTS